MTSQSFYKPQNGGHSQLAYGKCLVKYRVIKYSYIHDTTSTPDGISSDSTDYSQWTHYKGMAMNLRINKVFSSNDDVTEDVVPMIAIVLTRKGRDRRPELILVSLFLVVRA